MLPRILMIYIKNIVLHGGNETCKSSKIWRFYKLNTVFIVLLGGNDKFRNLPKSSKFDLIDLKNQIMQKKREGGLIEHIFSRERGGFY